MTNFLYWIKFKKMEKLTLKQQIKVTVNNLIGRETFAEFDYTDSKDAKTHPHVSLNSAKQNEHENFTFYSYSQGDGHGGGIRCFKAANVKNFKLTKKVKV